MTELAAEPNESPPAQAPHASRFELSFCLLAIVLVAVGITVSFWWLIRDPGNPYFLGAGDSWTYYGPTLHYMDNRIHDGEFPLWNPLYFCGQPHAANPQSWVFYPPNLLRSLLTFDPTPLRTHMGIAVMIGFHLLLGGVGALLLARSHGLGFGGSLVAAFAFTFSGAMMTRAIGHWVFLNTACWLPLILLLTRHALLATEWRAKIRAALAAGIVLGLAILGGVPNLIMLTCLAVAVYALGWRALNWDAGLPLSAAPAPVAPMPQKDAKRAKKAPAPAPPKAAWPGRLAQALSRDAAVGLLLVVVGLLIAAPLLAPAMQFMAQTDRSIKDDVLQEDFAHIAGLWNIIRTLILYQGHTHYEAMRGAGAGVFFLALMALMYRRRRETALFALLFFVLLDCSLSEPLLFGRLIAWIAPFKVTNPGRAMVLACLPLGLLAGAGADAVMARIEPLKWRLARTAYVAAAALFILLVLLLAARPEPVLPVGPAAVLLPACLCVFALAAGWICEPILWGVLIAMLVLGETMAWNKHLLPSLIYPYQDSMEELAKPKQMWAGNRRGTTSQPNLPMYHLVPSINGGDPLQIKQALDVLCYTDYAKNLRRVVLDFETTKLNLRGNLFLKRSFWLARQWVRGPLPGRHIAYPSASTVFLDNTAELPVPEVARDALPRKCTGENCVPVHLLTRDMPPVVIRSEDMGGDKALEFKPIPLPSLHTAMRITARATTEATVTCLFVNPKNKHKEFGQDCKLIGNDKVEQSFEVALPDFDEFKLYLAADFKGKQGNVTVVTIDLLNDRDDEDERIHILARRANSVDVELRDLPAPRILLCVDAWYPGWRAEVDGAPVRLYKANDAFKAVVVPAGTHRVRFVFSSPRVTAGLAACAATLCAIAAANILLLREGLKGR